MNTWRVLLALAASLSLLTMSQPASAGWGLPDLNPFSSGDKPARTAKADSGGWGLPKLPGFGKSDNAPRTRSNEKSMLTKTKETLFPWTKKEPAPAKLTGTRRTYQPKSSFATSKEGSGKSFFSSWFSPEEDRQPPMSPHEWLSQPRPGDG